MFDIFFLARQKNIRVSEKKKEIHSNSRSGEEVSDSIKCYKNIFLHNLLRDLNGFVGHHINIDGNIVCMFGLNSYITKLNEMMMMMKKSCAVFLFNAFLLNNWGGKLFLCVLQQTWIWKIIKFHGNAESSRKTMSAINAMRHVPPEYGSRLKIMSQKIMIAIQKLPKYF